MLNLTRSRFKYVRHKDLVTAYTDLESALRRGDESSYRVDLHFNDAGGEAEERLGRG
jgi:hypothetical protein